MADQATAATIRQTQAKVIELSFTAPDENTPRSTPTIQELLLSRFVRTTQDPVPKQQNPLSGNLKTRTRVAVRLTIDFGLLPGRGSDDQEGYYEHVVQAK